jgi:hypothetical protein
MSFNLFTFTPSCRKYRCYHDNFSCFVTHVHLEIITYKKEKQMPIYYRLVKSKMKGKSEGRYYMLKL